MPVVKPEAAVQFVVGFTVVPQQVPRAEIEAGIPREVTLAPRVAPVVVIEAAVGEVTVGTALAEATATSVQAPQLLPSFVSVIVPTKRASLSAQVRTEYVPDEGKVYEEEVTGPDAPAARRALELTERVLTVPPPEAAVATWKRLLKDTPVEADPIFEMVVVKVRPVPAVAEVGEGAPAVRSGMTEVVKVASAEYPVPVVLIA